MKLRIYVTYSLLYLDRGVPVFPLADVLANEPPSLTLTGNSEIRVRCRSRHSARPSRVARYRRPTGTAADSHHRDCHKTRRIAFVPGERRGWLATGSAIERHHRSGSATRCLLEPESLELRAGPEDESRLFELGKDYAADREWGALGGYRTAASSRSDRSMPLIVTAHSVSTRSC